jgi:uncharacterized protein (TIGR00255 family)
MVESMTGFGRAAFEVEGRNFEIEIRSVNHRHLDIRMRFPRPLGDRELALKASVQGKLGRGKVDVSVTSADAGAGEGELRVDEAIAAQYVAAARDLAGRHDLAGHLDLTGLLSMPGVIRFAESDDPDEEAFAQALESALGSALDGLLAMRLEEGRKLHSEVEQRLGKISEIVDFFQERAEQVLESARKRLYQRMEQIRSETGLLDEARVHQEIVIAADRLDIREELVRLRSHLEQFRGILDADADVGPVGRRLEFLLQEIGREVNTVGSKANDASLAHQVVELKGEVEKIREQVQNIA